MRKTFMELKLSGTHL